MATASVPPLLPPPPLPVQSLASPCFRPLPPPVFSTNTSYQRWDEARKMWGQVVNRSRDIARQVRNQDLVLASLCIASSQCLAWPKPTQHIAGMLPPRRRRVLARPSHPPQPTHLLPPPSYLLPTHPPPHLLPAAQALAYIPAAQVHLQDVICRWTIAYT